MTMTAEEYLAKVYGKTDSTKVTAEQYLAKSQNAPRLGISQSNQFVRAQDKPTMFDNPGGLVPEGTSARVLETLRQVPFYGGLFSPMETEGGTPTDQPVLREAPRMGIGANVRNAARWAAQLVPNQVLGALEKPVETAKGLVEVAPKMAGEMVMATPFGDYRPEAQFEARQNIKERPLDYLALLAPAAMKGVGKVAAEVGPRLGLYSKGATIAEEAGTAATAPAGRSVLKALDDTHREILHAREAADKGSGTLSPELSAKVQKAFGEVADRAERQGRVIPDDMAIMRPEDAKTTFAASELASVEPPPLRRQTATEAGAKAAEVYGADNFALLDAAPQAKDIAFIRKNWSDFYRNTEQVFGEKAKHILEPFDEAKSRYTEAISSTADRMEAKMKELGITPGSEESAAVQKFGEQSLLSDMEMNLATLEAEIRTGRLDKGARRTAKHAAKGLRTQVRELKGYDYNSLVAKFGEAKAVQIVEADKFFRAEYDSYIARINDVRSVMYNVRNEFVVTREGSARPLRRFDSREAAQDYVKTIKNNKGLRIAEETVNDYKLVPKRKDYYRHFQDITPGSLQELMSVFDMPEKIPANLVGLTQYTHPKTRFLPFALQRKGFRTKFDAIGGFMEYMPKAEFAINMDPMVARISRFHKELKDVTTSDVTAGQRTRTKLAEGKGVSEVPAGTNNLNNYIDYIGKFQQQLANKTNHLDRFLMEEGISRDGLRALSWANSRLQSNIIGANISSALVQPANLAQGFGEAGTLNMVAGMVDTMRGLLSKDMPSAKSSFLQERYLPMKLERFETGWLKSPRKFSNWMLNIGDEAGTTAIWNGIYRKAVKEGRSDPIRYANNLTRKMVGGRGIGEMPFAHRSKMVRLIAPFQYEVGNLWWVMRDWVGKKEFGKLARFFVASYLMNKGYKAVMGRDVMIDPIQTGLDIIELQQREGDMSAETIGKMVGRAGGEVLSEIPLGQTAANLFSKETRQKYFGSSDPTRFGNPALLLRTVEDISKDWKSGLLKAGFLLGPPTGGNQLRKSVEGAQAIKDGWVYGKDGQRLFRLDTSDPETVAKSLLFGPYATPEAREFFDQSKATGRKDRGSRGSRGSRGGRR